MELNERITSFVNNKGNFPGGTKTTNSYKKKKNLKNENIMFVYIRLQLVFFGQ